VAEHIERLSRCCETRPPIQASNGCFSQQTATRRPRQRSTTALRKKVQKSTAKTLTHRVVRGQQGINFIERVVLDMHCSWTPTGATEIGIDGYIELFDPASQQPLGKTLAVQSKVIAALTNDRENSFDYLCAERDLQYWLRGNMPVLLIVSRPDKEEAYWLSIKDFFNSAERVASRKAHFDKARQRFDKRSLPSLLQLGRSASEGLYLGPTPEPERLLSNLLHLEEFPDEIWIADTTYRRPQELWPLLNDHRPRIGSDWLLHESKVYSFQDLSVGPWATVCDQGTCESFATREWAFSAEQDRRRRFVELLNRTIKDQLYPDVRFFPATDCFAFAATLESAPVKRFYRSVKRRSAMTVVMKYKRKSRDGREFTWLRHLAFRRQFRLFEERWYLEITPTYVFTWDGVHLDRFHEQRLKRIKIIEGNRAVLAAVLFWSDYLKARKDLLYTSSPQKLSFGELASTDICVGLDDAAWGSDGDAALEKSADQPDDLLSLLPGP